MVHLSLSLRPQSKSGPELQLRAENKVRRKKRGQDLHLICIRLGQGPSPYTYSGVRCTWSNSAEESINVLNTARFFQCAAITRSALPRPASAAMEIASMERHMAIQSAGPSGFPAVLWQAWVYPQFKQSSLIR
jgi:hypothetical protein